jgi:dihydroflavonol-4-reductase
MNRKELFELWYRAAGRPRDLLTARGNMLIPDFTLSYLDYGATNYETPAEDVALLGFERGVARQAILDSFPYYASLG